MSDKRLFEEYPELEKEFYKTKELIRKAGLMDKL